MPTSRLTITGDIAGVSLNSTLAKTAAGKIGHEATIPAAAAGTLSTRVDDDEGTLTVAGHGLSDGDLVDVYWSGGRRYDVVVGTVVGDAVPFSGGAGDMLPAADTAITVAAQQEIDTDFDGDLVVAVGALLANRGRVGFYTASALALSLDLDAATLWYWLSGSTAANPLAGVVIDRVVVTQASSDGDAALKLGLLYNSLG